MTRALPLAWLAPLALAAGCDLDQSFIFPDPIEGVPGVMDLGTIVPVPLTTKAEVRGSIIYGEIGPTGTAQYGGITLSFEGIDGPVCVWVDPELVFWNQSVSQSSPTAGWAEPDNVFDDGDLDLYAGLTPFYSGTPGVEIGGFEVSYLDQLGNPVRLDLEVCAASNPHRESLLETPGAQGGRGSPEYCTIPDTVTGERYTVVLDAWSLPRDDARLGFGVIVSEGRCGNSGGFGSGGLVDLFADEGVNEGTLYTQECLIKGEAIQPGNEQGAKAAAAGLPSPTWIGPGEAPTWPRSTELEEAYCGANTRQFCRDERDLIGDDEVCSWEGPTVEGVTRCFCGDPANTPEGGAF